MGLKKMLRPLKLIGAAFILMALTALASYGKANAAGTVAVTEINYDKSTISVQMGAEDTVLMISDSKKKKWETVTVEPENGMITMDISWITLSKDYVLSLKGDKSTDVVAVTIPAQNKNFKATYSPTGGITFTDKGDAKIQWKKKDSVTWLDFPENPDDFKDTLEGMIIKGCSLVFRTAPVNGDGTNPGRRASKEITVTVKAKAAAPAVNINTDKMTISLKKNMEYRYCDENGDVAENANWTLVEKDEEKALSEIAGEAMAKDTESGKNVYIQFRYVATATSQLSNIATVTIPGQKALTSGEKDGISMEYTSPTSLNLTVSTAKEKEPFEYFILTDKDIEEGMTLDTIKNVSWVTISDNKAINIVKTKAGDGSIIYVRKKAIGTQGEDKFALPSTIHALPAITYPKELSTLSDEIIWISCIEGLCRQGNTGEYLQFNTYSSVETPISEILMTPSSGGKDINLGESDFTSTVRALKDADMTGWTDEQKASYKYLVTTTIKDTTKLEASMTDRKAKEYLVSYKQGSQGEFFKSDVDKGGVGIYIHPKSILDNPKDDTAMKEMDRYRGKGKAIAGDEGKYLDQVTRYYNSNVSYDPDEDGSAVKDSSVFSFVIDLGIKYSPVKNSKGEVTNSSRGIQRLVYDGVELPRDNAGTVYFVTDYYDYVEDNVEKRKVIVTVNLKAVESNSQIKAKDEFLPLRVYVSHGEYVDNAIYIKFSKTGVIVEDNTKTQPITISRSINSALTTQTTSTTTVNGVTATTTTEDDVFDTVYIYLNESQVRECVEIENVTYDGVNIFTSADRIGNYIYVKLSKDKLNKKYNTVTTKLSKNVIFTFDNGFTLSDGYRIIMNPAQNN